MINCFIIRFWSKVEIDSFKTDCWIWKGKKTSGGYGISSYNGKITTTHRISYQIHKGEIPKDLVIDHLCRNRSCVNPDHLEAVTQSINAIRGRTGYHKNRLNSKKTHCPKGHQYTGINNQGSRICHICIRNKHL